MRNIDALNAPYNFFENAFITVLDCLLNWVKRLNLCFYDRDIANICTNPMFFPFFIVFNIQVPTHSQKRQYAC